MNATNSRSENNFDSDITVTITYPENGLYLNNKKILPFFIPLVIRGPIGFDFEIETSPGVGIDYVEFYVNDGLQYVDNTPPFEREGLITWWKARFSHIKIKIIAYGIDCEPGSDEITIWRLFS